MIKVGLEKVTAVLRLCCLQVTLTKSHFGGAELLFFCAFLVVLSPSAVAQECTDGRIVSFAGKSDGYVLKRAAGGETVEAAIYMPMCAGDQFSVIAPGGLAVLQTSSGSRIRRSQSDGPYTVKSRGAPPGAQEIAIEAVGEIVTAISDAGVEPARGVGEPMEIAIPCLSEGCAIIGVGRRPLAAAWAGGTAPFVIKIMDPNGETVISLETQDRQIVTDPITIIPGQYTISLEDSGSEGDTLRYAQFDAIADPDFPSLPFAEGDSWLLPEITETVNAIYLASEDDGTWAFEAYLRLLPHLATHAPAQTVADSIAAGIPVDTP